MFSRISELIDRLRQPLQNADTLPLLSILGICVGIFTGLIILIFRQLIEIPASWFLGHEENFESLPIEWRFALPVLGALTIGIILSRIDLKYRKTGVAHVIERLEKHQGYMPVPNAMTQFFGAAIAAISGQSIGREGPAVHLGAASASWLGQRLRLPNNSLRTLIACGVAAAIAASFNTPIAGVIFAMEVVLMEYSLVTFTPVILASVIGAVFSQIVYGSSPAFDVPHVAMQSFWNLPFIILLGIGLGILGAAFIQLSQWFRSQIRLPVIPSFLIIGISTGLAGMAFPYVLGIGYDSVTSALAGQIGIGVAFVLLMAKLVLTSLNVGLGMPAGLIGPTLVMGAALGSILGVIGQWAWPEQAADVGFFAMLGMGGMMAATLQAPLAALMAMLELTSNPDIILPGMLVVVIASMTVSEVFKLQSIFLTQLNNQGLDVQADPVVQALRRTSISRVMSRSFAVVSRKITAESLEQVLAQQPSQIIIEDFNGPIAIMPGAEASNLLARDDYQQYLTDDDQAPQIDLLAIPATRKSIAKIDVRADLQQAIDTMNTQQVDMLFVSNQRKVQIGTIVGWVSQNQIDNYYQYK